MKKNIINKGFGRLVTVVFCVVLLMISATQVLVAYKGFDETDSEATSSLPSPLLSDTYFIWEDLFGDGLKVDPTMSYNYDISGGTAKIKETFPLWTDPSWTRMKQITITNNAGNILYNYALHLTIPYDSEMKSDYGDLRFKHENSGDVLLNYWM
ncbi:MAG: hypothetical protein JW840_09030, partial [Candidatus Thermoplasmatota archaeon]|nr:hypothetical protein [Candidatus Thermoplasmatota archaeon]